MDVNNKINCYIHNKFDIEVIDGETGKIKQKAEAYNIVLDNLWHYIIETTTAFGTYIQYGSGTGTPIVSRTSLFSRYSGKSVTQDELTCDYVNRIITRRVHINLPLTEAVGINITEVGLAAGTGDGSLSTHAMLQDMNGNTISIQKTEFDIINIYATIYCHWDSPQSNMGFYPYSDMQSTLTGGSNIFGSFTGCVGTRLFKSIYSNKTWSKTNSNLINKTITYTLPRYSQSEGNCPMGCTYILGTGSFSGIAMSSGINSWSPFNITNEAVGTGDGVTVNFKTKFNAPYNATVYINGIAQSSSDVTILENYFLNDYFISLSVYSTENNFIYCPITGYRDFSCILYNPFYISRKLTYIYWPGVGGWGGNSRLKLSTSNNLDNNDWTLIKEGSGDFNIPSDKQNNKYFKMEGYIYPDDSFNNWSFNFSDSTYNIIFNTPPADGDVITVDYTTNCIPKDTDHVMDATITFVFGDYTP